jgi:alpha-tubulin suppressor-like RCC1 family protein
MDNYGITMTGPFTLENVSDIPEDLNDGRIILFTSPTPDDLIAFSTDTDWFTLEYTYSLLEDSEYQGCSDISRCSMISTKTGRMWAWGDNINGRIGNNTTTSYSSPVAVVGDNSFIQISAGESSTLAIRGSDGTCWAWGYNGSGQLGTNNTTNYSSPVSIVGGNSFTQISSVGSHSLGLDENGIGWAWGFNGNGQLGTNNRTSYSSPVSIVGGNSFSKISAGAGFSLAIRGNDGTGWAWGYNGYGQLGNNNRTSCSSPISIVGENSFIQISAGSGFSLAIRGNDGSGWAWGFNNFGELGHNNTSSSSSPVSIVGGMSFIQIYAGTHSLAIDGNYTGWAWGSNAFGQLGTNNDTNYSSPVSVEGNYSFTKILSIYYSSFAITTTKEIFSWGKNDTGQLGNNSTTNRSIPGLVYPILSGEL